MLRRIAAITVLAGVWTLQPARLHAQDNTRRELRESQLRLEQIRAERQRLQDEMAGLQTRVRDASRELANIERQRIASSKALRELEFQTDVLNTDMESTGRQRGLTQARLVEHQAAMNQRLRSIYKRGPLNSVRVLLSAENFSNLLSRYKYLNMVALYERMLVDEVSRLEKQLRAQELQLRENLAQLDLLRGEKEREVGRLRALEGQHQRTLRQYQQRQKAAQGRIVQLEKDAAALSNVIANLERRRRDEESRSGGPVAGTLTTRDLGALNWPVDGNLVFRFGPERRPNGVVLRYNGIGIAAPVGTPVKAVEAGSVQIAGPLEGYGQAVVVSHGAGAYTLYFHLQRVMVQVGQSVFAGQMVGTVGGSGSEHGPHLEFQVRVPTNGSPAPVDPLDWLRARPSVR
ncbi:MAG: murein hydrolase activator EnvC family protein [Longimicrobiales bacterium]